jgi:hypothetical protein
MRNSQQSQRVKARRSAAAVQSAPVAPPLKKEVKESKPKKVKSSAKKEASVKFKPKKLKSDD